MMLSNKNKLASGKRSARSEAFTLIEILVVIAISVVLFGILIRPLIDSLRYSQDAQRQAAAQDSTRKVMEMLSREVASAAYVSDGTGTMFNGTTPSATPGIPNDQYTNFLDLDIPLFDTTTGKVTDYRVGHAYNAKLDYTMARRRKTDLVDPTADLAGPTSTAGDGSVDLKGGHGTAIIVNADVMLPIAPGTTMVRWWIGLQNPEAKYIDARDKVDGQGGSNTYVLYRAQFSPVKSDGTVNNDLFDVSPTTGKAFIDDPDFFRVVTTKDVNWNNPAHAGFAANEATAHNLRLKNWELISKPIINAPSIDMLVLPHNSDRTVAFDTTGTFAGIAHFGATHDPVVNGQDWPLVHTSVNFQPGIVTADAAPATNNDYSAVGVPQETDVATGLPYVPTTYVTAQRNWSQPYTAFLYPVSPLTGGGKGIDTAKPYFYVTTANATDTTSAMPYNAGDLVEHSVSVLNGDVIVYDITTGVARTGVSDYVPLALNPDLGTINFSVPAIPQTTTNNAFIKYWMYTPDKDTGNVDLTADMIPQSGALPDANPKPSPLRTVTNAHMVPGTLTVYGPDTTPGTSAFANYTLSTNNGATWPNLPQGYVQYTPIGDNVDASRFTGNVYQVTDWAFGTIKVPHPSSAAPPPVFVSYSYQANSSPLDATNPGSSSNPFSPYLVKVEYHSRDVLSVDLGVRYFNSDNSPQTVSLRNELAVGNANR